jgi:RimJ/RimL family protein N-acetyltransferase
MEIRRLTERDAESMCRLRLHALEPEPNSFRESPDEMRKTPVQMYAERLGTAAEDNFVLGAFEGAELIGMVGFYRDPSVKCRHKGWIWGMFVAQSERGKGTGFSLLSGALDRARKLAGLEQVRLTVATTQDAARKLYIRNGFRSFGTEPKALHVNGSFVDEDHMFLPLSR